MRDVLANLISVPKEYQVAIEMTLGQTMQNIVTDDENTAKKLVEYLRKNNLGRASFLPITSVKGKKIEKINSKNINGVIGIASDLVKNDKDYDQIILNLLGRTVIVEDMDSAIALAKQNSYSFRIVTLKGDLINPSGAITGGSVMTKTVNILGRKKEIEELEQAISEIKEKVNKIKKEKTDYLSSIEDILSKSEELEKIKQQAEIVYATEKQKITQIEINVTKLENKLAKVKEEIENIKQDGEVIGNRTRVKVVKNKVAPPFREAEFDILYGEGISKEGSILDLAVNLDIVEKSGAWFSYNGAKIGQGRENVKKYLKENPKILAEIEQKIRDNYSKAFEQALDEKASEEADDDEDEKE